MGRGGSAGPSLGCEDSVHTDLSGIYHMPGTVLGHGAQPRTRQTGPRSGGPPTGAGNNAGSKWVG